jgi:hypothetical protein
MTDRSPGRCDPASTSTKPEPTPGRSSPSSPPLVDLLATAVTVAWLVLVGASYAAIFLFPGPRNIRSLAPAPPDLSAAYLPLLAAIVILGIFRRWFRRPS